MPSSTPRLGRTGFGVSRLCLGCMSYGDPGRGPCGWTLDAGRGREPSVRASRVWTQGYGLELEPRFSDMLADALRGLGHAIERLPNVGGGMGGIRFHGNGDLEGAAGWCADGTPVDVSGGFARAGEPIAPDWPVARRSRRAGEVSASSDAAQARPPMGALPAVRHTGPHESLSK